MSSSFAVSGLKVLVIDGGGLRGLAYLMIIDEIMKAIIKRGKKHVLPCEFFDLICGTSVGGFISVLLGRLGLDCPAAIKFYQDAIKTLVGSKECILWNDIAQSHLINMADFHQHLRKATGDVPMFINDGQNPDQASTKAFVPIMEDGPAHPNRLHIIRSYATQGKNNVSSSVDHEWTVSETVTAAMASQLYSPPFNLPTDNERSFRDAGFGGYNNPAELALNECQSNWPGERIGIVISLGAGLQSLLPQQSSPPKDQWTPPPQYVREICDKLFSEKLPMLGRDDEVDLNIMYSVRDLICTAANSSVAHERFRAKHTTDCKNYYRIDDSFGLDPFDLVDIYQTECIRDNVNEWLREGGERVIAEIGSKLVSEKDTSTDKKAQSHVASSLPKSGVLVSNGNEPRPGEHVITEIESKLVSENDTTADKKVPSHVAPSLPKSGVLVSHDPHSNEPRPGEYVITEIESKLVSEDDTNTNKKALSHVVPSLPKSGVLVSHDPHSNEPRPGEHVITEIESRLVSENDTTADKKVPSNVALSLPKYGVPISRNPHLNEPRPGEHDAITDKTAQSHVAPSLPQPCVLIGPDPHGPRPTRVQDYLRFYEVMFIIDDSGSMRGRRWEEAHDAVMKIAESAFQLQANAVSIRFLNNSICVRGLQSLKKLKEIFESVRPRGVSYLARFRSTLNDRMIGRTPTGQVLKTVFEEHLTSMQSAISQQKYSTIAPLDIIVITDGTPRESPADVIKNSVKQLQDRNHQPNAMGVQFVQIGNDQEAARYLKSIVKSDNGGIVDSVPFQGTLTPDVLQRILLGSMHRDVRAATR